MDIRGSTTGERTEPAKAFGVSLDKNAGLAEHTCMAKNTTVTVTDDIDGSSGAEEVSFSYKGTSYTIDLSKRNASAFDKALKPYLDAATKTSVRTAATRGRRPSVRAAAKGDVTAIRAWAAETGHKVNARGRIPKTVLDAYEASAKK